MFHTTGNFYQYRRNEIYILAQVSETHCALIGLHTANRFVEPVQVSSVNGLTEEEFNAVCGNKTCHFEQVKGLSITMKNQNTTTQVSVPNIEHAQIYEIAEIIRRDWKKVYFGAKPYLDAMMSLGSIQENYGADSGKSIVTYFLGNATTWRGPVAKAVKAELNKRIKAK